MSLLIDDAEAKIRRDWEPKHYEVSIVNVHGSLFRIHDDEEVSVIQVIYSVTHKERRNCTTRCLLISDTEDGRTVSDIVIATRFIA